MRKRYDIVFALFLCLGPFCLFSCSKDDLRPVQDEAYVTLKANLSSVSEDTNVLGKAEYAFKVYGCMPLTVKSWIRWSIGR